MQASRVIVNCLRVSTPCMSYIFTKLGVILIVKVRGGMTLRRKLHLSAHNLTIVRIEVSLRLLPLVKEELAPAYWSWLKLCSRSLSRG